MDPWLYMLTGKYARFSGCVDSVGKTFCCIKSVDVTCVCVFLCVCVCVCVDMCSYSFCVQKMREKEEQPFTHYSFIWYVDKHLKSALSVDI